MIPLMIPPMKPRAVTAAEFAALCKFLRALGLMAP